jgi:hypothetical protein
MGNLALAQTKKRGAWALKEAKELGLSDKMTARSASRELIDIYWGLRSRLGIKARVAFDAWFKVEHEKAGNQITIKGTKEVKL